MHTGDRHSSAHLFSHFLHWIKIGGLAWLLSGCQVSRYLEAEGSPTLLRRNHLLIKAEEQLPLDARLSLQSELGAFFRQKPNERSLLAFGSPARLWWYFRYRNKDSRFARWVLKRIAEPPVYFDEKLTERTRNNFQNYLRQRGYLNAQSHYKVHIKEHAGRGKPRRWAEATVFYTVELGPLHRIASVHFFSADAPIDTILRQTAGGSLLKRGDALDRKLFDAERNRITYALKNRGYAFFQPAFVEFLGDSSGTQTRVRVEVDPPDDSTALQVYSVGKVEVFLDFAPELVGTGRDTTLEGIYFTTSNTSFAVKPERLLPLIAFRPEALYRQEDFDLTARNLNSLGVFQFVTIRPSPDSLVPGRINVTLSLSVNKRLSVSAGADLNSSTNSGGELSGRLFGVSAYLSNHHRNLLRGAENLHTDLSYSTELDLSAPSTNLFFSQELKFQNELLFPRYFDYLGVWHRMNRWRVVPNRFYEQMKRDARTRIALNYGFLDLRGFYQYHLLNAAWGYTLRLGNEHQLVFDNAGIDILKPALQPRFDTVFGRNEFLRRSFGDQLFTGFLLRSITYFYTGRPNVFGERWFFRLNAESSGLEEHLLNRLWSIPFGRQTWTIGGLDFSKYLRLDLTASYTRDFAQDLTGVVRVSAGVAQVYGNTPEVPFVKQFFVGGPSSLRAWRIREIGPGGYVQIDETCRCAARIAPPFFQAANFRFEFNGELRFPLFWWLKGAIFVDGGNIWTLQPDANRPLAQLRWDSFRHIALGTGFGLRFDFDYFVFRFDWGIKMRRPYQTPTERHWVDWSGARWRDISNFNVAVGYPF